MKKIKAALLAGAILLTAGTPCLAQEIKPKFTTEIKPKEAIAKPLPLCKTVEVTPGNPLKLKGTGTVNGKGHGEVHFKIEKGRVSLAGKGVVAVKASNNDTVNVSGWGHKIQIGDWVIYYGRGSVSVRGDNYEVIGFGRLTASGSGTGSVVFRGHWRVRYCRLLIAVPEPIPTIIPEALKKEVEIEK